MSNELIEIKHASEIVPLTEEAREAAVIYEMNRVIKIFNNQTEGTPEGTPSLLAGSITIDFGSNLHYNDGVNRLQQYFESKGYTVGIKNVHIGTGLPRVGSIVVSWPH